MVIVASDWLAQLPASYVFINPIKLAAILAFFAIWAYFAQWADKDAVAVNTYRTLWNLIVLGVGLPSMLAAFLIPMFAIGYPVFVAANLAVIIAYVIHRNGLVDPKDTVLTAAHLRRIREQGLSGKKKVIEVKEKVRLTGADGRVVPIPVEEGPREQYRLTQDLFFDAFWRRAAVTEIVPVGQQANKFVYEVDGIAMDGQSVERAAAEAMIAFIKQIAGLNLEERRKPQHGEIMAAIGGNKHKVFVRSDGSAAGEKVSIRILYRETSFKVPDLGFTPRQLEAVQSLKAQSKGLIVLSAPPRSGLTTTVYSFIRDHDRFLQNVQTIEYRKELDLDNVTQHVFDPAVGTFAERLIKVVRADPDIIVIPDLRDREAAAVAAKAAIEKQKVYIALNAEDLFDALRKWIAAVGDKTLVARGLLGVSNQRLVRVLCTECKQAYKPDPQMMRKLNLPADKTLFRPPEVQYDKKGNPIICQACQGTGYVGRTGIFEWLTIDDELRDVIRRSASMAEIQTVAAKRGGLGLQAQGLQKVLDGVTSVQEVARVTRSRTAPGPAAAGKPAPTAAPTPKPSPKPRATGSAPAGGEGR